MLLLTNQRDVTADLVVRRLRESAVPYLRLNSDDISDWTIDVRPHENHWEIRRDGRVLDLSGVVGVWFRRPDPAFIAGLRDLPTAQRDFGRDQWSALIRNLEALPGASWINPPARNRAAESKALQLRLAQECGLNIPRTLITNNREDVLAFAQSVAPRGIIAKGLHSPAIDIGTTPSFVYTRLVDTETIRTMAPMS